MLRAFVLATLLLVLVACASDPLPTPQPIYIYEPSPTLTALCEKAVEATDRLLELMKGRGVGRGLGADLVALQDLLDSCMRQR